MNDNTPGHYKEAVTKSIDVFDVTDRIIKTTEEFGELFQALSKYRSNPNQETAKMLWVEITDARIALDQWDARIKYFGLSRGTMDFIKERQQSKFISAVQETPAHENDKS